MGEDALGTPKPPVGKTRKSQKFIDNGKFSRFPCFPCSFPAFPFDKGKDKQRGKEGTKTGTRARKTLVPCPFPVPGKTRLKRKRKGFKPGKGFKTGENPFKSLSFAFSAFPLSLYSKFLNRA